MKLSIKCELLRPCFLSCVNFFLMFLYGFENEASKSSHIFQRINKANSLKELRKINLVCFFLKKICPNFHITQQKGQWIFRYFDLNLKPFHSPNWCGSSDLLPLPPRGVRCWVFVCAWNLASCCNSKFVILLSILAIVEFTCAKRLSMVLPHGTCWTFEC
jgi:hypothetical protein